MLQKTIVLKRSIKSVFRRQLLEPNKTQGVLLHLY